MKKNETKKAAESKKATPITITVRVDKKNVKTVKATSVCNMWKLNKELFKEFPAATLFIKKDGEPFMKLHLVLKSNGKTWMKNDIEASRRKPVAKKETEMTVNADALEDEVYTIDEQTNAEAEAEVFADAE